MIVSTLMISYLSHFFAVGFSLISIVEVCGFTSCSSSFHTTTNKLEIDDTINKSRWGKTPYIALLTEPDACSSLNKVEDTIQAIASATIDGNINIVVVRVNNNDTQGSEASVLKWALLKRLADMKKTRQFLLVVNDDVDIVLKALSENIPVDGVHVKEYKSHLIPSIRSRLEHVSICSFNTTSHHQNKHNIIIGTSCHSIESGRKSYELSPRGPDYLFVGTCYLTQSHPEKDSKDQLEGPSLPGKVKEDLHHLYNNAHDNDGDNDDTQTTLPPPIIFAIGGIDQHNCHEPVLSYGADGVATIRTVMQAFNPSEVVQCMKSAMTR